MLFKRLRETGECTALNGRRVMRADLYQGANGTWELDVYELDGPGSITNRYEKEEDVRRALQAAYEYGRRHGTWRIQTAADYYAGSLPKS